MKNYFYHIYSYGNKDNYYFKDFISMYNMATQGAKNFARDGDKIPTRSEVWKRLNRKFGIAIIGSWTVIRLEFSDDNLISIPKEY